MISKASVSLVVLSSFAPAVLSHSFLEKIWADGVEYEAWDPNEGSTGTPYPSDTPSWYTENAGGSPLKPVAANTPDIVCALRASPALFSAPITPGTDLTVKWWMAGQPFPDAHWGPIIDYIAPCNGPCASISKTALQFVKIAEWGWIDNSTYAEGFWATNEMIAANGTWPIRIPAGLSPGEYVVRHELIALHVAFEAIGHGPYFTDGAEFYPQCVTIVVGGTGTKIVEGGIGAMELYRGDEPGLAINIHTSPNHPDYVIPGPPVWPLT